MEDDLVTRKVRLPRGELRLQQPREAFELPDDGGVEWAPMVPYWSVLWRSGVALARALEGEDLAGKRVVELGCGLGVPSIAAARAGARVLATDEDPEALELLARNADRNRVTIEALRADWATPAQLLDRGPFDLAIAADVLYERQAVAQLLRLLPALGARAWVADPGRPAADVLVGRARERGTVESNSDGVVGIHRISFDPGAA